MACSKTESHFSSDAQKQPFVAGCDKRLPDKGKEIARSPLENLPSCVEKERLEGGEALPFLQGADRRQVKEGLDLWVGTLLKGGAHRAALSVKLLRKGNEW